MEKLPNVALMLNQITSSQAIRAFMVVTFSFVLLILVLHNRPIPDAITAVLFAILGYYFGEAAPMPKN